MNSDSPSSIRTIARTFAEIFRHWEIVLPADLDPTDGPRVITKQGWHIRYLFGADADGAYMEYYAQHRMTNDRHVRIYESGREEHLEAIDDMVIYDPAEPENHDRALKAYEEKNRRVADDLRSRGLMG